MADCRFLEEISRVVSERISAAQSPKRAIILMYLPDNMRLE